MSGNKIISVIIPVFRDWNNLRKSLKGLSEQSLDSDLWEIILVNNDPNDPFPDSFLTLQNTTLLTQPVPGSYAARNLGVKKSNAEIVVFLDSDCYPDEDWLANGLKRFEEEGVALIGGRVDFYKTEDGSDLIFEFEKAFSFDQKKNVEVNGSSITANLFVKKFVFDHIGMFSEKAMSGEDFYWTKKASNSGFKLVYDENVIVGHPARKNWKNIVTKKKRTAGGQFVAFYQSQNSFKNLFHFLKLLRPPVKVFTLKERSFSIRTKLFFLKWHREWVGVIELIKLNFFHKNPERS